MTKVELDIAFRELKLEVPERERNDILHAVQFIDEMRSLVRKPRDSSIEPANSVSFPELADDI